MRFYHVVTLGLAIICLFGDSGLGAPTTTGRYAWVKCRPEGNDANCVTHMGPLVPLAGNSPQLPPSATKQIFPVTVEEATPEMEEQSGEGSGNSATRIFLRDAPERDVNKNVEEGSTAGAEADYSDIDYSNYVFPEKRNRLSAEDLKEEHMIP